MNINEPVYSTNSALEKPQTNPLAGAVGRQINAQFLRPPFFATRRDLIIQFRSKKLVEELIEAGWIKLVLRGGPGCAALYDYASAERAAERLKTGEEPQAQPTGGDRE